MGSARLYSGLSTWLRITAVAWLITTSTRVTANMVNTGLSPAGDYILTVALVMLSFYVAASVLACDTKPYVEAMLATLVFLVISLALRSPMETAVTRALVYLMIAFIMILMFVHGGLDIRKSPIWGSVLLLAPVTVLAWGVASEFGPAGMQAVVGDTMPALLIITCAGAGVFALIFESQASAEQAVEA